MITRATAPLRRWLAEPVDNATLVVFRLAFGLLIGVELCRAWSERVEMLSWRPIRFPYDGWGWLPLLPPEASVLVHACLFLCCVCIALGYQFRVAAPLFAIGYSYSFLLDRAYFNNHFYLICLLGGWLAVGDAHRRWSLDALQERQLATNTVPRWQLVGPAIQMAIPYVYGGIAKINGDWLRGEPMRAQLWELSDYPLLGTIVMQPLAGIVFAWGGMLFDLFIVPALLWRKSRWAAVVALLLFHLINMQMFQIGIFPWLGMASVVLFLPPRLVSKAVAAIFPWSTTERRSPQAAPINSLKCSPLVMTCFVVWLVWQCLMPLRHYFIPGNVGWTREGFYFAWTMKLDLKSCFLGFHICNPDTGECLAIDHDRDLTDYQRYFLPREPRGIVQYAKFLRYQARKQGLHDLVIVCDSVCALNGRPYQYMIDPAVDPSGLDLPRFGHAPWIVPLDQKAPIGVYKIGDAKEQAVMQVVREVRMHQGVFPDRLRGKRITDITPSDQIAR